MSEPTKSIEGLRIIVAGAAGGIGAATAHRLARHGAKVIVGDINEKQAIETAASITSSGGTATAVGFDFSKEETIKNLINKTVEAYGGIDGLINMGADLRMETIGRDGSVLEMDADVWRRTMDVNLIGYALTTKHVLPHLFEQGGAIVNISSVVAWMNEPSWPAYAASKAGVHTLTRHTATSFGPKKVRANGVSFGIIGTEPVRQAVKDPAYYKKFIETCPLGRPGEVEEASSLVEYLVSRESSFITGQIWGINGGVMMRE